MLTCLHKAVMPDRHCIARDMINCRYAREIAMLKTRLAEKDAQLMGGFGALANMQLGSSQGWLGGLPDPESIAASLPDQARPYIHSLPHPSPTSKAAWGVKREGGLATTARTSSSKGALGLSQQLPSIMMSADARLTALSSPARSIAANRQESQLSRQSAEGMVGQRAGLNAASYGVQTQGGFTKPSQAKAALRPLSYLQSGTSVSALPRLPASASGISQEERLESAQVNYADSAKAAGLGHTSAQSAESLPRSGAAQAAAAQAAAVTDDDDSASESDSEAVSESESSLSDAPETAGSLKNSLSGIATVPDNSGSAEQVAALQQFEGGKTGSLRTSDSNEAVQISRQSSASGSVQSQSREDSSNGKTKKKWRVW